MTFVLSRPQEDNILCTAEHEQEMVGLVANLGGNRNAMTNRGGGSGQSTGGSNANSHNANVNANANQQHGHTPNPYSVAPTLALYRTRTRSRPEHRRGKPHEVLALVRTLKHRPWCAVALVVGLLATVAFVPALLSPAAAPAPAAPQGGGTAGSIPPHKPGPTGAGRGPSLLARREGSVRLGRGGGGRSIGYTHQPASTKHKDKDDQHQHHLVLLHGAAFSRADWDSFGILDLFRKKHPWLAVTALDLPVSAGYADLFEVLDLLAKTEADADTDGGEGAGPVLRSLPVSALVTPSASGRTVTSWIQSVSSDSSSDSSNGGEKAETPTDYFRLWIPVACYSVQKCTKGQLEGALAEGNGPLRGDTEALRVLAIYGDKDPKGKTVSEKLGESLPRSTVLELPGGHPVYRDSPDAFVDAVAAEVAGLP